MRLRWKILFVVIILLIGLISGTTYLLVQDANFIKDKTSSEVEQLTGRKLSINTLRLWLIPIPWLQAKDIHFQGLPGEDHDMAYAQELRVGVALFPLLSHHVVLKNIKIFNPDIHLLRKNDGEENWLIKNMQINPAIFCENICGGHADWHIRMPDMSIKDASFHYEDDIKHIKKDLYFPKIELHHLDHPQSSVSVALRDKLGDVLLDGKMGQIYPFNDTFPMNFNLTLQQQNVETITGQFTGRFDHLFTHSLYHFNLSGQIPNLASIQTPSLPFKLPQSEPITLSTNISGHGLTPSVNNLHFHTGHIDLTQWMAQSSIGRIDINSDASQEPMHVYSDGHFGHDNFKNQGHFGTLQIFSQKKLKENIPVDLAILENQTSMHLKGELGTQHSNLDLTGGLERLPLKQANSQVSNIHVNLHAQLGEIQELLIRHEPVEILRALQVNGQSHIENITWQGAQWKNIESHIESQHGKVALSPIRAYGNHEEQHLGLIYDLSSDIPHMVVEARPFFVPLPAIRNMLHLTPNIMGQLQIVGRLESQGKEQKDIEHHLNGHMGFSIANGVVNRDFLVHVIKTDLAKFSVSIPGECMGAHLHVRDGNSHIDEMGMQVLSLRLQGTGNVGLISHLMDVRLRSQLDLFGRESLPGAVSLKGPWEEPDVEFLAPPEQNSVSQLSPRQYCESLLNVTREGMPGPRAAIFHTSNKQMVNKTLANKLGIKENEVEKGEHALGINLDFLDPENTNK